MLLCIKCTSWWCCCCHAAAAAAEHGFTHAVLQQTHFCVHAGMHCSLAVLITATEHLLAKLSAQAGQSKHSHLVLAGFDQRTAALQ
jgi:hypothetical protein